MGSIEKLYHIARKGNLKSILDNGLLGSAPKVTETGEEGWVYLTDDYEFVIENDEDFWSNNLVLLEVDVREIAGQIEPDPEYVINVDIDGTEEPIHSFMYNGDISPDKIRVVGSIVILELKAWGVTMELREGVI